VIRRTVLWEPWNAPGAEYLELTIDERAVLARGTMVRFIQGEPVRAEYTIACDGGWRAKELVVSCRHRSLTLDAAQLSAADDVDLYACAFTNTLPIRRSGWAGTITTNVLFITLPDLRVETASQAYARTGESAYRFTSLSSGFTGDITVDEDAIVVDYTSVVRRVWPAGDVRGPKI
jgi:hypothetical protein